MKLFLVIYFSIGFGVVVALSAAGYKALKKFKWKRLVLGHFLAFILWPVACWNNRDSISSVKK